MKELKGETKIIITDLTLDAILKMFKTPEEKESFQKCWGWGLVEWQALILCKDCKKWKTADCKRVALDEHGRIKRQSMDTFDTWTDPDDYCKDGEAK